MRNKGTIVSSYELFMDDATFIGMCDYMPPFCHGGNWRATYMQRMKALFVGDYNNQRSKHPRTGLPADFFEDVLASYPDAPVEEQRTQKIDLHPMGIILLQLAMRFGLEADVLSLLQDFAARLMSHGNDDAHDLMISWLDICGAM